MNNNDEANSSRVIIKILRELAEELDIGFTSYSYDWIVQLTRGGENMYIYGYQFPANDASAELICGDKAALASVLIGNGIPAVEHEYFMSPSNLHYTGEDGNWARLSALLKRYGKIVLKRNSGSGGSGVFAVSGQAELEKTVGDIFKTSRALSASPYYDIDGEYRIIYCYGDAMLVYKKIRPSVTGDGKHCLLELIAGKYRGRLAPSDGQLDLTAIPASGEEVTVNWKHNLGQGASAEPVPRESKLYGKLTELALRAAKCVNVNFASVDIVDIAGELRILEINSGIMMENFAVTDNDSYATAKYIYGEAIRRYFHI